MYKMKTSEDCFKIFKNHLDQIVVLKPDLDAISTTSEKGHKMDTTGINFGGKTVNNESV